MKLVIFEDSQVHTLSTVTLGRGAFAITCGTFRMIDLLSRLAPSVHVLCRPYLEDISQNEYPQHKFGIGALLESLRKARSNEWVLAVNARLAPESACVEFFRRLLQKPAPTCGFWQDSVAFCLLKANVLAEYLEKHATPDFHDLSTVLLSEDLRKIPRNIHHPLELFDFAHDIVRDNMRFFDANIEYRLNNLCPTLTGNPEAPLTEGKWTEIKKDVWVGRDVKLGEYLVTDTSHGPILIDDGASVGPFCYLKGPVYIGPNSKVIEHAALKDYVGLTHTTKVGGEVEASSIEPFTNKQHHGFLGHSYLGSWINLGAGTCNSDLKNTYGTVSMDYGDGKIASGMQFHGCIIGDFSKTAINTSIFTGKVVGACSMVYGFVTRNVPSFVNYARSFGQCTELPVEVMISTQQRMFARRNVVQEPYHAELLRRMFELSVSERQMENEPLSL